MSHRGADRDQHRPQPHDAGVEQRLLERLTALVHLLDEIEQHDDVAGDDVDQAGDAAARYEGLRSKSINR